MPTENRSIVFVEDVNPWQPTWERSQQLNGIRISDACFRPTHFPEHSHSQIKIAVPLEYSSIQVRWQTASGYQKQQLIQAGQVSIIPANLPREIVWEQESELVSIYLATDFVARSTEEFGGEIVENWTASDR